MSTLASQAGYGWTTAPDWNRGFYIRFHLRRISLWLRLWDFLDVAQGIADQELARLSASRLTERAWRLRMALSRVSEGDYGVCSECGNPIPAKRLAVMADE